MTSERLTVREQLDPEFGSDDILVKLGAHRVFGASRFENYSTVFWNVHPTGSKEGYFRRLAAFYNSLQDGSFRGREAFQPDFKPFVFLTYGDQDVKNMGFVSDKEAKGFQEVVPFEHFINDDHLLLQHPHFGDFRMLRVYGSVADLVMEDYTGAWKQETGVLCVLSHNNLSTPVARLISETARIPAPASELEPILAEKVYQS